MYWEIAGHVIALTGDGYYDDGWPDEWLVLRCLGCPGHDRPCNHILFMTEEDPVYDADGQWVDPLYPRPMLEGVVRHLQEEGAAIPAGVVETARMMVGLGSEWSVGIDIVYEGLGGGGRRIVQ